MPKTSATPDLDELARKYLDLWQEHLNAVVGDGENADVLARTVALMNSGAAAFTSAMQDAAPNENSATTSSCPDGSMAKSKTAGTPHEPANFDVVQCLERISALEKRVSDLEGRKRKKTKPEPSPASKS